MAKIQVEYDTVEKTCAVSVDGTALANVVGVQFGLGYGKKGEYRCEVMQMAESEDDDMYAMTRIVAGEDGSLSQAAVEQPDADEELEAEILEYFGD
jgi:hypothetical protein